MSKNVIIKIITLVCLILFLCLSLVGCTDDVEDVEMKSITVNVGESIEITLNAYGGSLYTWEYNIKPKRRIEFTSRKSYFNSSPDYCGGGEYTYTFVAKRTGECEIKFSLKHRLDKSTKK